MTKKEKILKDCCFITLDDATDELLNKAMDDYAKHVFEFGEWASSTRWVYVPSQDWWFNEAEDKYSVAPLTAQQLFKVYEQNTVKG